MSKFVYFIEAGKGGPIKIGSASDVDARIKTLQTASSKPIRLIVAIDGDHKVERHLHRRFAAERTRGEWFKASGEVRAFALSLVGMSTEERDVAVAHNPPPPKTRRTRQRKRSIDTMSVDTFHSLFFVGDSGNIYRSREAEEALAEERRRTHGMGGFAVALP